MSLVLNTGFGFWNPILWLIVIAVALLLSWLLIRCGRKDYDKNTEQTKPYLSGNEEPKAADAHVRGGNLYYGFTHALKGYYDKLIPLHTGILNDYIGWFLLGLVIVFLVVIFL